jgi:YD repeat-containing protein
VTTFGYDSLDRLQTVTDPLLRTQSYAYDDANRVTTQTFTDGNAWSLATTPTAT